MVFCFRYLKRIKIRRQIVAFDTSKEVTEIAALQIAGFSFSGEVAVDASSLETEIKDAAIQVEQT